MSEQTSKKTPSEWQQYKDARENEGAQQYPNYWVRKTRTGHVLMFDDSKGNEAITLQHCGGSMIQLRPDGSVYHVSHNGQQTMIFGENRTRVTGSQDTTVEGDVSMKAKGDFNQTVIGDSSNAVAGDSTSVVAGDSSTQVAGNIGTSAKTMSTRVEGGSNLDVGGVMNISAKGGISMSSPQGATMMSEGGLSFGGRDVTMASAGSTSVSSAALVAIDAPIIHLNNGLSKSAEQVTGLKPDSSQIS